MTISLQQFFANNPVGSTVANPEGLYAGECVSLVRQKMKQVDGVVTSPLGNAADFATNPTFLTYYEKVANPRNGDIMIWGDDPGNWTGKEGHDGIYRDGQIYNQNFGGSRKVSINPIFTPGFIGYFRLKGEDNVLNNKNDVDRVFIAALHEPTKSEEDASKWYGIDALTALDRIRSSPQWLEQNYTLVVSHAAALQEIATLKLAAPAGDADKKLQAIKDALSIK